jgi:hypothetical protein
MSQAQHQRHPTPAAPADPFIGYHRPNRRAGWRRICTGQTYDQALDRLLDAAPPGGDVVVVREDDTRGLPH